KKAVIAEVAEVAASAHSAVAAEYRGLSVSDMTDLRAKARASGVYLRVVKNTLARRAVEGTAFECMRDAFEGPLMLAFSREDPGSAARVVRDFAKSNDKLVARLVSVGGQLLDGSQLARLASLPTRDEALAQLMATMRAPLDKLARTLNEVPGKLTRTVAAVRDAKG
ncbi:MAG: 50S ribosomal protein L10, partial [Gammaproteobacteria bacterium]|nr:50S ribosomal protein L10 [Gammaproteobacteria bacterium]